VHPIRGGFASLHPNSIFLPFPSESLFPTVQLLADALCTPPVCIVGIYETLSSAF
jgi:hypothetical protein